MSAHTEHQRFDALCRLSNVGLTILIGLAVLQAWQYWPALPEQIPSKPAHPELGMDSKWLLIGFATALLALIAAIHFTTPLVLARWQRAISVPNRAYWLAPERRAATVAWLSCALGGFTMVLFAMVLSLFEGVYRLYLQPPGSGGLFAAVAIVGILLAGPVFALTIAGRFRLPSTSA